VCVWGRGGGTRNKSKVTEGLACFAEVPTHTFTETWPGTWGAFYREYNRLQRTSGIQLMHESTGCWLIVVTGWVKVQA